MKTALLGGGNESKATNKVSQMIQDIEAQGMIISARSVVNKEGPPTAIGFRTAHERRTPL